jgi:SAM-dependent methyltransferase
LGSLIGGQVELVHADATALPFPDEVIDGVWTVQTLQHIPSYIIAFHESYRVLKKDGRFINYSLHITPVIKFIYKMLEKNYHENGDVKDLFYLRRANNKQKEELSNIFTGEVFDKFSECLFHPDLKLTFTGKEGSWIGRLDYYLGNCSVISNLIARQRGFEVVK